MKQVNQQMLAQVGSTGRTRVVALLCALFMSSSAWATKYVDISLESKACGTGITSGTVDGVNLDVSTYPNVLASPTVQCSPLTAPNGTHYLEWNVPQVQQASDPHGIGPDIVLPSPVTLVSGTTYYLASFWRFERINGRDLWTDWGFDFDKLIEMNGTGFRWIVLNGWNGDTAGAAHRFAFTLYGSDAVLPSQCGSPGTWHYYSHDYNGYSKSNPYYSDYEKWIPVVMGITAVGNGGAGRLSLWVDGIQIINKSCINTMETMSSSQAPQINKITMSGTVGQPKYVTPPHKRQVDKIMLTDNWQDIVNGGYLVSPSGSAGIAPPAPTLLDAVPR